MPRAATKHANGKGLKVGQRVVLWIGKNRFKALVVEDRGNLGVNGRRILGLRALQDGPVAAGETFEWPEEELKPIR